MRCEKCRASMQVYTVRCVQCGRLVYPTLAEPPTRYVCQLCQSGAGSGKRESGRKGGIATAALRKAPPDPDAT